MEQLIPLFLGFRAQPQAVLVSNSGQSTRTAVKTRASTRPQPVFTWKVREKDTLASIAESIYDDDNVAWLIADLNRGRLKECFMDGKRIIELDRAQILLLPDHKDAARFRRTRQDFACAENLVTIRSSRT